MDVHQRAGAGPCLDTAWTWSGTDLRNGVGGDFARVALLAVRLAKVLLAVGSIQEKKKTANDGRR